LDETLSGNFEKLPVQFIYLLITIIVLLCFELGRKIISANYKKNIIDSLRSNVLKGLLSKRLEEFQVLNNQKYVSLFTDKAAVVNPLYSK
jgi:ABC-type transport system involved in cytochrome bd biosynthesis fused ATPase/permease subunit